MAPLDLSKPALFTIEAYLDSERKRAVLPKPSSMEASYDLSSVKKSEEIEYEEAQGISTNSAISTFYANKSSLLSVKLIFNDIDLGSYGLADLRAQASKYANVSAQASKFSKAAKSLVTTGKKPPSSTEGTISPQIALFERLCQEINGESHEPSYLRLSWLQGGLRSSFEAKLKDYDLNYTLIGHDGRPLLAELNATFVETVEPKKELARLRLSSPDLSHRHLVLAGETLPMLCQRYYGNTAAYLQVAMFNGLDDFVALEPGIQLLFPPLAAPGGES
jgi:hypothetical protein